jgi:CTP synthase
MQLAVIEFARNVLNIKNASTTEFEKECIPLVALITQFKKENESYKITEESNKGGTMRLGSFSSKISPNTLAYKIYQKNEIKERHRHRYEVNINYKNKLEEKGMIFSGISKDEKLTEIIEIQDHPFFIGVQYHPEFKSNLFEGHPLFKAYLETILKNK